MGNNDIFSGDEALSRSYDNTNRLIKVGGAGSNGTLLAGVPLTRITTTKTISAAGDYAAGDVLASASATGTGLSWTFSGAGAAVGATGAVVQAEIVCSVTAQAHRCTLYLFTATPTGMLDDNSANTSPVLAEIGNYIGKIDFPAFDYQGTGISSVIATPSTTGNLPIYFDCAAADTALYGVLTTRDAFTNETANNTYTIRLFVEQY